MDKFKKLFFSENGMKIVNIMFLLSLLIRNAGFIFLAFGLWIVYLLYCMKHTSSPSVRIAYKIFIGIATALILLNLYFLLMA